jgi:SagB-type dehydrogenase family enzyme
MIEHDSSPESDINIDGYKDWPETWTRIYYKTYPRFPRFLLTPDREIPKTFSEVLYKRFSADSFGAAPLSLRQISNLLHFSAGLSPLRKERRFYASGGARYPLEIYPLIIKPRDIPHGLYHFNVKDGALELLFPGKFENIEKNLCLDWRRWTEVSMFLIITAVFTRNTVKYGEPKGTRLVHIESGFLGHNICLVSTALDLSCRPIGGFRDEEWLTRFLEIDGIVERPIYMFAIGS